MKLSDLEPAPAPELVLTRQTPEQRDASADPKPIARKSKIPRGRRVDEDGPVRLAALFALFVKGKKIAAKERVEVIDMNGILRLAGQIVAPCDADYVGLTDGRVIVSGGFPVFKDDVISAVQWR